MDEALVAENAEPVWERTSQVALLFSKEDNSSNIGNLCSSQCTIGKWSAEVSPARKSIPANTAADFDKEMKYYNRSTFSITGNKETARLSTADR